MRKHSGIICIIVSVTLLFSTNSIAQKTSLDSLQLLLSTEKNDTVRIKFLIQMGMELPANCPKQEIYFNKAQELSEKKNFRLGIAFGEYNDALKLCRAAKYDDAIEKCIRSINILDSMKIVQYSNGYPLGEIEHIFNLACRQQEKFKFYTEKLVFYSTSGPVENTANCLHGIASYYSYLGDCDKAIEYYFRAWDVYKLFDPKGCANEQQFIGSEYLKWGNLEKAEQYLKSALKNLISINNNLASYYCYHQLGDLYFTRKNYLQAFEFYFEGNKYCKDCPPEFETMNLVCIGTVFMKMGSMEAAKAYLDSADKNRKEKNIGIVFSHGEIEIDYNYYKYYLNTGNEKLALRSIKSAMAEAQRAKYIPLVKKYAYELYSILLKQGDSIAALRYQSEYYNILDTENKLNSQARISTYEIEKSLKQRENQILQLQIQESNQRKFYIIGAAFILIIAFGIISRIRYIRKVENEKLLEDFKQKLAKAETKALRAQMNPHFIFNSLNSINCFIIEQKHELASDYLIKFSKLIRQILDNSGNETIPIAKELETLKLYVALERARFENKFTCLYEIDNCLNIQSALIPPMLLQPFVENAIWHGLMHKDSPGTILINIRKEANQYIKISISDDGIGRQRAAEINTTTGTHKSFGMKITSNRIDILNKLNATNSRIEVIDLKDDAGNATGTRVDLIIPYIC